MSEFDIVNELKTDGARINCNTVTNEGARYFSAQHKDWYLIGNEERQSLSITINSEDHYFAYPYTHGDWFDILKQLGKL